MGTGLRKFEISNLNDIDNGRIAEALRLEMKRVLEDLRDRPTLESSRKIKLQIDMTPICEPKTFDLDAIDISFKINSTFPNRERLNLQLGVKKDGSLVYSEHSPRSVDQKTVFDDEE